MHSVTSGAVYSALNTVETYTSITGLTLYKIGCLVFGKYFYNINSSSPFTLGGILPTAWRPRIDCQVALINSSDDIVVGQLVIYKSNGEIKLWNGGGNFNGRNYTANITYVV